MIAFVSLFLGLVIGSQPVTLLVDGSVAAVEMRLDGRTIGRVDSEPWTLDVDFGLELAPHLLEAVALDGDGAEIGRARQWINLPRPPAEARLLVEPAPAEAAARRVGDREEAAADRGAVARVVWESVAADRPSSFRVLLDGRPLEVEELRRFELPPLEPDRLHYLRVELEFPDNVASVVEATFGGSFGAQVESHQMAFPVLTESKRRTSAETYQGRISKAGEPIRVLGVDEGPAEIVVVRDLGAQPAIDALARSRRQNAIRQLRSGGGAAYAAATRSLRTSAALRKGQHLRLLEPVSSRRERAGYDLELFPPSPEFTRQDGGLFWILTQVRPPVEAAQRQRLADAVAVAGMTVSAHNRRRAVILILGDEPLDDSQHDPRAVLGYLESLRVPLFVWSASGATEYPGWGEALDISNLDRLERELRAVHRLLERQRIVWLEGFHLPQRIHVEGEADGRLM